MAQVAREGVAIRIGEAARERMARGRARLEELLARGERIYGVNTGVGGNVGIWLAPEEMELLQANLVRQLGCATGQPLPADVVRAATLLRVATFLTVSYTHLFCSGSAYTCAASSHDYQYSKWLSVLFRSGHPS